MAVTVTYPGCGRRLNAQPTSLGKQIRCPACSTVFTCQPGSAVPVGDAPKPTQERRAQEAPPVAMPPVAAPVARANPADAFAFDEPQLPAGSKESPSTRVRPKSRPPTRKRSSASLWIGLAVLAGFILLCGIGGAGLLFFMLLRKPSIPDGDWTQFTTPDGECSVLMPGTPVLDNSALKGAKGNKYLLTRTKEDAFFTVAYVDLPTIGVGPSILTKGAVAERDALQKKVGGTATVEQDVSVLGYAGRELQIQATPPQRGVVMERLFLVPKGPTTRLYIVGTGGSIIEPGTGAAAKFFDSLAVKAAPAELAPVPAPPNPIAPPVTIPPIPPFPPIVPAPQPTPSAPKPDAVLTEAAKVDPFLTCAVDTDRKTAFFCGGSAFLKATSYPDFKVKGTYAIGGIAYRSALDAKGGKLYLAVADPKDLDQGALQAGWAPNRRVFATAKIHVYDVTGIATGEIAPGTKLKPSAVYTFGAKIEAILLSPDGSSLFYLDVTDPANVKVGHIETANGHTTGIQVENKTELLRMSPDGKKLYTAVSVNGHQYSPTLPLAGTFQVFDTVPFKLEKSFDLDVDPFDVAATDDGLLYVPGGSAQSTDLTVIDAKTASVTARWPGVTMQMSARLSPDGKRLYTSTTQGSPGRIYVYAVPDKPEGGKKELQTVYSDFMGYDFYPTPDGQYVLIRAGKVYKVKP
ncbi:MAG TPA: hypothetical protein DDY78_03930 [Planctomycetales bacterium]|jgi:hypothetical protein|nr:hypothetical protein [Planctomycetales bacterium]